IQNLADTNVEQMTCEGAGLSPVGASCTVATAVDGFNGNRVEKFDSSGSLITAWGGSPAGGELDGTTCANGNNCGDNPHFDSLEGVAVLNALPGVPVKPEGSLLVLASQFTEWSQSSGDFITIIGDEGHESPIGIAVDPAGHVYVGTGGGGSRKEVIQTSYCNKEELSGPCPESNAHEGYVYHENCVVDPGPATGVAVDPSSEDVYVARYDPVSSQGSVAAYGSACNPLESPFGGNPGEIVRPAGVAASGFSGSKGYVYVVDEGSNRVEVFAPGGLRHKLTVSRAGSGLGSVGSEPAGTIACPSLCSASLSQGTVVTLTATPPAHASFVGWAGGGCSGAGTCQLTLTADTAVSAIFAYDRPVLTPPALAAITANTATLDGTVNPEGDAFSCRFEYGTTTAYGAEAPCLTRPGAGAGPVSVSAELWDLAAGTTYHYRLVSVNSGGASYGPDQTFTTASETCATDAALCLARPVEVSLTSQASGLPSLVLPKQPGGTTTARGLTNAQKLAKALKACGTHRKKGTRVGCEKQARKKYGPAKHKAKKSTRSRKRG
ncbi:MAG TPA: hypothetical protein VNY52_03020, partial [Solirubrobacteraceae bacterium]|nr:hypothetical protein [Solirubrobacteraceae bacterium]